jgi:hypothetical protein
METLTIAIIVITLTVVLFSSISYSYVSPDPNAQVPIDMLNSTGNPRPDMNIPITITPSQIDKVGKVNPKASTFALYNLPEKDEYMTTDLRNQIDTLRTQYYYDNCQQVSPINFKNNIKIGVTDKFQNICSNLEPQVSFENYKFTSF